MFPNLQAATTSKDPFVINLASVISEVACQPYFKDHLDKSQKEQKAIVTLFQRELRNELFMGMLGVDWSTEFMPSDSSRDSIDIYGEGDGFVVAIEIDKNRADQVAKKFVSRMAILPDTKVYYISICYPGTKSMSKSECVKYFGYCGNLAKRMGNEYLGFIIEPRT